MTYILLLLYMKFSDWMRVGSVCGVNRALLEEALARGLSHSVEHYILYQQ